VSLIRTIAVPHGVLVTLSLMGWLLLFPPQSERSGEILVGPNESAPLRQWNALQGDKVGDSGAFPTKSECEEYRSKTIVDVKRRLLIDAPPDVEKMPSETRTVKWTFALGALKSRCVSSNDPRLKAK
jgi:hypothetical protein